MKILLIMTSLLSLSLVKLLETAIHIVSKGNAQRMLLIWMAVAAVAARQIYVHDGAALEAYVPETD